LESENQAILGFAHSGYLRQQALFAFAHGGHFGQQPPLNQGLIGLDALLNLQNRPTQLLIQPGALLFRVRLAGQLGAQVRQVPLQVLQSLLLRGGVGVVLRDTLQPFGQSRQMVLQFLDLLVALGYLAPLLSEALLQLGHLAA
jgi:hypothetical protein